MIEIWWTSCYAGLYNDDEMESVNSSSTIVVVVVVVVKVMESRPCAHMINAKQLACSSVTCSRFVLASLLYCTVCVL